MVKIIESAQKEFIGYCGRCGCKFSYELKDLHPDGQYSEFVKCPECKAKYTHPLQRKQETIELKNSKPIFNNPFAKWDPWYIQPENITEK